MACPIHDKENTKLTSDILAMSSNSAWYSQGFLHSTHTYRCLRYSLGCHGSSWDSKLAITCLKSNEPAIILGMTTGLGCQWVNAGVQCNLGDPISTSTP